MLMNRLHTNFRPILFIFGSMEDQIINRVAQSQLITLNPADFFDKDLVVFDLKDFLYMELILKEKEFRAALNEHDWTQYENKHVALTCSADAIVPLWAYMLVTTKLQPVAKSILSGNQDEAKKQLFLYQIGSTSFDQYDDKRIVLKGCGDESIPDYAYVMLTEKLLPYAKSIMYGEPCSTVPVYKKRVVSSKNQ